MCGRFTTIASASEIVRKLGLNPSDLELKPNYNAAPTNLLPIVAMDSSKDLITAAWGLIPSFAKDKNAGFNMINLRSETMLERPYFNGLLNSNRCLIIADSFYEWKKTTNGKQPYRILMKNEEIFTFAGVYDTWNDIKTFSIITTKPNPLVVQIHDRMPAIISNDEQKQWLSDINSEKAFTLLDSYSENEMKVYQVSQLVNSPRNNGAKLIMPI